MTLPALFLALQLAAQDPAANAERAILSPPRATRDVGSEQIAPAASAAREATAAQVTTERRAAPRTNQLSTGGTAEPSAALSRPADGRGIATVRVEGSDRCDPSASNAGVAICARPIETRSRDYARPDPLVLSPEQRLLVDQRLRAGQPSGSPFSPRPDDAEKADPSSLQGQTVAAIVRRDDAEAAAANAAAAGATGLPAGVSPEALVVIDALLNQNPPR